MPALVKDSIFVLIPIKDTASAKQRLSSLLDQTSRTKLAQAMLWDVLTTLHRWRPAEHHARVAIVTNDTYATHVAREYSFEIIPDPDNPGETAAIEMATKVCLERGAASTLVMPADIPLIEPWELDEILSHAPEEGSLLVPADDRRGTNAAFRRPANLFPLRFGNDSFMPHHAAAQATGKPCVILNLPGIAVDVDNPEDLRQLISLPGATRAQELARQFANSGTFGTGKLYVDAVAPPRDVP